MSAKIAEIKMKSYFCKKTGVEENPHYQVQFYRRYRAYHAGHPLCEAAVAGRRGAFCGEEGVSPGG
jgi:hypothetical protein